MEGLAATLPLFQYGVSHKSEMAGQVQKLELLVKPQDGPEMQVLLRTYLPR